MGRLPGFDYSRPFFYMVTLKATEGAAEFARITDEAEPARDSRGRKRYLVANEITYAFSKVIKRFAAKQCGLGPIETFIVMPDHIHILFLLQDGSLPLGCHVAALIEELEAAYRRVMRNSDGRAPMVEGGESEFCNCLSRDWHDWIVKKEGQLAAFTRYIRENPKRAWLRRRNRRYFGQVRRVHFAGHEWFAYGNAAILEMPVIEPFKCSRKWSNDGEEWRSAVARAGRIGPGGAGAGTFMSACEKECGNAIYKAGGSLIVLSPEGFGERWHPPRNKEALCAKGRMLFLSLWEADAAKPDNATLYRRCHEMGDAIVQALAQNSDGLARLVQHSDGRATEERPQGNQSFAEQADCSKR